MNVWYCIHRSPYHHPSHQSKLKLALLQLNSVHKWIKKWSVPMGQLTIWATPAFPNSVCFFDRQILQVSWLPHDGIVVMLILSPSPHRPVDYMLFNGVYIILQTRGK